MATASDTGNPPRPLAPRLRVGDGIPVFSLPNTSGVSVSSTVLLEPGPLIITFYRGIWCPYCRSDLMALMMPRSRCSRAADRWRPSRGKRRRTAIADFNSNTGSISRS